MKRTEPLAKVNAERKAKRRKEYRKFMASAAWHTLRRLAMEAAGYRCATCGDEFASHQLHAHHATYARFGGKELPEDIVILCRWCHEREHALAGKRIRKVA